MKITVVVATYNRSDTIVVTLKHLAAQTLDPRSFEVIVVDDGSPDDTEAAVRSLEDSLPYELTYMKHPNRGPGATQNRGIRAARAPLICLIADDIHLVPGALQAYVADHEKNPGANVAILGKVIQSPELRKKSVFLWHWDPFKFRHLENMRELPYYLFWACNISLKKDFMLENGLFRETRGRAGAAAHEDVELGCRLSARGLRILYNKDASGQHYHVESLDGATRRAYVRGLNWGEFRSLVDRPDITVRYHILNIHTIRDHIDAFRRPNSLIGADRNLFLLAVRQLIRTVLFNPVTVPRVWLPLMARAEKNSFVARLMHRDLYRGVIAYHFFKGAADGHKRYRREDANHDTDGALA
ncbi:MAG: glycosyltransferase family 2 protein [Candidatus Krumholzibacteriia bacterium]